MEVEENVGDDVVDVKVDESEVNVDVEEEEEKEAVVAESVAVELDILQALRFLHFRLAQTAVYHRIGTRGLSAAGCNRAAADDVDMIDACSNFRVNQRSLLWTVI